VNKKKSRKAHISYIQAFISPAKRWKKPKPKSPKRKRKKAQKKMKAKAKYQTIVID